MRQPHAMNASSVIDWLRTRIMVPATTEGRAVAARVMLSQKPRRSDRGVLEHE